MRLKPRFDPAGVLWFDNVVVTYLRWFERWYNPPKRRLLSPRGAFALLLTLALWGLAIAEWSQGAPLDDPVGWLFLLLSVGVAFFSYYRRRHPLFHPAAPVRVGFTSTELLWQAQDGRIERRPWSSISDARVERDEVGGLAVTLWNAETSALRSMNPDLAVKLGWACRAARRGSLDISSLARPVEPVRVWKHLPSGGVSVSGAMPEIFLYPDRLIVFSGLKLLEFRRADIDAFVYPDSGEKWLVVTAGDRHPAKIFLPQSGAFLEWVRAGLVNDAPNAKEASLQPPVDSGVSPGDPGDAETGRLK